jgi:hypothetical protein
MYVFADRDWEGVSHLVAALILCAAAAALLFVSLGGDSSGSSALPGSGAAPAAPVPRLSVRHESAGSVFEVAGASFTVAVDPPAGWASSIRARRPKPGQRWFVAAVEVVNGGRHGFNPGLLSYLARGPHGALYAPLKAGAVGPQGLGLASGLPAGARAEERLVFSLPAALRHPVLAIQPSPARALEVRVPLVAGR